VHGGSVILYVEYFESGDWARVFDGDAVAGTPPLYEGHAIRDHEWIELLRKAGVIVHVASDLPDNEADDYR
jgi:hypothetical protein